MKNAPHRRRVFFAYSEMKMRIISENHRNDFFQIGVDILEVLLYNNRQDLRFFVKKGKEKMKKFLSAFLAIALVATLCAVFASAEDTNIALNKTYTTKGILVDGENGEWAVYPDENGTTLTDGAGAATADYGDAAWAGFGINSQQLTEGENGSIVIDLGGSYTVSSFNVEVFGGSLDAGIDAPSALKFSYSTDGTTWTDAGEVVPESVETPTIIDASLTLDAPVTASSVKVEIVFNTNWAFVSEVEVYGAPASGDSGDESSSEAPVESTEAPVESTEAPVESTEAPVESSEAPNTGDAGIVAVAAVALVAIVGAAVVIRKRA